MASERPFAVFDIDGTLIRWQLYHAVADELARQGHFDQIAYEKIRAARQTWKNRASDDSYRAYEQALINLVDAAITHISAAEVLSACRSVLAEYKDQIYIYTRNLISELKIKGYLLFAISASQSEIVGMLAEYYGFDDYGGSVYEASDGHFTGKKFILSGQQKPELLKELVTKHGATFAGSIGVGDSEGDIPMLSIVEQPIAFNPANDLYQHAKSANWKIVLERKNVIYELEGNDGRYQLV